jgi:site-specific recombinase XerD
VNYLRKGGSVFHLQKMLGHSTLETTRRYANLMTRIFSKSTKRCRSCPAARGGFSL